MNPYKVVDLSLLGRRSNYKNVRDVKSKTRADGPFRSI